MKKNLHKLSALFLAFLLIFEFGLASDLANATTSALISTNIHNQDYPVWSKPMYSYLMNNADGTLSRIEYKNQQVYIETYNSNFKLQSATSIKSELPLFGGFYSGKTYNYIVFGQSNSSESNETEVYRIVQYSKDWSRVASDSLYGANTKEPFNAGSLRMCEYNNTVYVRTCHTMYRSSDGYNHQANVTFSYDNSTHKITNSVTNVSNSNYGYSSHSFNQFIKMDNEKIVAVDHGDAYPRSIAFFQYPSATLDVNYPSYVNYIPVKEFSGAIGANYTYSSVGGFEVSNSNYLVAYNTVPQDESMALGQKENIYIGAIDRNNVTNSGVKTIAITDYENENLSTPQLIEINKNSYMLLWQHNTNIEYVMLDGTGSKVSSIKSLAGSLSDCQPIVYNSKVTWYVTYNSAPTFYSISTTTLTGSTQAPTTTQVSTTTQKPITTTQKPVVTTQKPATTTQAPVTTTQKPATTTQAPVATTQNPATTTQAPVTTTQKPTTTQRPAYTTQKPAITTQVPTISSTQGTVKLGTKFIVNGYKYKITRSTKKSKTVQLISVSNRRITTATVKATVQLKGTTYKVTSIGTKAFYKCKKLRKLKIKSKYLTSVGKNSLKSANKKLTIYCPKSKLKKYKKLFKKKTGYKKSMKIK